MRPLDLPVAGGALRVGVAGEPRAGTVLAVHGITANHGAFGPLVRELGDDVQVVAPDLRGRGHSNLLPPPYGIRAHVDDAMAVLDHLGMEQAVVVGHSMGGWVGAALAVTHPERVRHLVLVDGGIALAGVEQLDVDEALQAVLGPAMVRLAMTFPSVDDHRAFWRQHPAYAQWTADIERFVDYDLQGEPPQLRSRVSIDAVRGDAAEQLGLPEIRDAVELVRVPTTFLRAPRGLLDGDPLYPREVIDADRARWPAIEVVVDIDDTNHYTAMIGPGAATVAEHVRRALHP